MSTVLDKPTTVEGRNYIYGEFRLCRRPSMDSFDNINPSTGESLGSFPQSTGD